MKGSTLDEKFSAYTRSVDGGHLEWTGPQCKPGAMGTAVVKHKGTNWAARRIAFVIANGRPPTGYLTAECDHPGCVAPAHVADEPTRVTLRAQYAKLIGLDNGAAQCHRGHSTAEHGRYTPDGNPYCGRCHADTIRAARQAAT